MIRKIDPPDRPWKPRWDPRPAARRRRARAWVLRALVGSARVRIAARLLSCRRPQTFGRIAIAPSLAAFPRRVVFRALVVLIARGEVRWAEHLDVRHRSASLRPVFWHRDAAGADHG